MQITRTAAYIGVAKKLYDDARKPEPGPDQASFACGHAPGFSPAI